MPNYLWRCEGCGDYVRILRTMSEYKVPPNSEECGECRLEEGHTWEKVLEMPKVLKESYVSGQRMKSDQSYADYAKSLEIDSQLSNHRRNSEEYKEMKKESNRLKGRDVGETTRNAGSGKTRRGT